MNEKSKLIKIIQKKDISEEDRKVIKSLLGRLSKRELITLLKNDFKNYFLPKPDSEKDKSKIKDYDIKIKIEKKTFEQIYRTLKSSFGYSIPDIARLIEIKLETFKSALYRGNAIPVLAFEKLKEIYGTIPHTKMIGNSILKMLLKNADSAELVGIMLGDGYLSNNKIETSISLNGEDDPEYLHYVITFLGRLFDINIEDITIDNYKPNKLSLIRLNRQVYHKIFTDLGLIPGNKVKNQIDVPTWIFNNKYFIIRCLRGLIDTDGTIQINKLIKIFRITFCNASKPLVDSFKKMCNILGIHTGSVLHTTIFDTRYNKYYDSYYVNINAKKDIKKIFKIVCPKKFEYRKKYYSIWLLILKNPLIYKIIKKRIKQEFPKKTDRAFSKEFSEFLYSIAIEYDFELTDTAIDKTIDEALKYVRCVYSKELGRFFTLLYKKLGSCNLIRKFLEFYNILDTLPYPTTITNFISKYLIEEKNTDFFDWKKTYTFNSAVLDESKEKIKLFPNKLRSILIKEIFDIYYCQNIGRKSFILTTLEKEIDNLYLVFLLENEMYFNAFRIYLKELITLVIHLIDMVKKGQIRSDIFIKQNFGISFSTSTISYIKKEVKRILLS